MKLTCIILLLCVASVFAVIEEKKCPSRWAGVSSNYDTGYPRLDTATKMTDGDINTFQASTLVDKQPYMSFSFQNYPAYVTYVDIVNRQDCCQERISPFTMFLGTGDSSENRSVDYLRLGEFYSDWRQVTGVQNTYRVPFPHVLSMFARLQQETATWMNIAEVSFVQLYRVPYLGTAASSQYSILNPRSFATDSNVNTWFATYDEISTNPWFEVYFAPQKICKVIIWNRYESCCSGRIDPFNLAYKNGNFTYRPQHITLAQATCADPGVTCIPGSGVKEYYDIDLPNEPVIDRVRLFQTQSGYMNIADIQIYGCSFPADFAYQI